MTSQTYNIDESPDRFRRCSRNTTGAEMNASENASRGKLFKTSTHQTISTVISHHGKNETTRNTKLKNK